MAETDLIELPDAVLPDAGTRCNQPVLVTGAEFMAMLEGWDISNNDAAKLFHVTPQTITSWLQHGIGGIGAQLVRLFREVSREQGLSVHQAVEKYELTTKGEFSRYPRRLYRRKS